MPHTIGRSSTIMSVPFRVLLVLALATSLWAAVPQKAEAAEWTPWPPGALSRTVVHADCVWSETAGGYYGRIKLSLTANSVPRADKTYYMSTKLYIDQWKTFVDDWRKTGGTVTRRSMNFKATGLPYRYTPGYKDFLGVSAPPDEIYRGVAIVRLWQVRKNMPDRRIYKTRINVRLAPCSTDF